MRHVSVEKIADGRNENIFFLSLSDVKFMMIWMTPCVAVKQLSSIPLVWIASRRNMFAHISHQSYFYLGAVEKCEKRYEIISDSNTRITIEAAIKFVNTWILLWPKLLAMSNNTAPNQPLASSYRLSSGHKQTIIVNRLQACCTK